MDCQTDYHRIAKFIADTFPKKLYRGPIDDAYGYRFVYPTLVLQIKLCEYADKKEMHLTVLRLAPTSQRIGGPLIQALLEFCSQHEYTPVAHFKEKVAPVRQTSSFWSKVAGFKQNPERPTEYLLPSFTPSKQHERL